MVTIENWEEYAILRADGELDAAGKNALETFLAAHPELAEEARAFDSLRLVPDESIVFAGKESLLKPEPRVIRFDRRWVYGVAAGVALLLGSLAVLRSGKDSTGEAARLAGEVKIPLRVNETPQKSAVSPEQQAIIPTTQENTAVAQANTVFKKKVTPAERTQEVTTPVQPANEVVQRIAETITPISSADDRVLAVSPVQDRQAESPLRAEDPSNANENREGSRSILDRLPIERERLVVLDDIRKTASDRIQSIRQTREKIRNTDVTVALGRRDLFTLHF